MKLEVEKSSSDEGPHPYKVFVVTDAGRHPVDLSMWSAFLISGDTPHQVELQLLRPSGLLNSLFGESSKLYLRIKRERDGEQAKAWLWSLDDGRTWGPVTKMPTKAADMLDRVTIAVGADKPAA